jgi:hypothetical protein
LVLNRDKGRFAIDSEPEKPSLTRKLWDSIGLDKN